MEILAIGKPTMNVYLPLQGYPNEGELFFINNKIECIGNVAGTAACLLGKWGINTHFTGMAGNDEYANSIKEIFNNNGVDIRYFDVNYSSKTSVNYITLNTKTGISTKVFYNDDKSLLTKFKYEFNPEIAIIDGTDYAGAYALMNNYGSTCKTVFYAQNGDKDTINFSKKCSYVICSESFAESMSHIVSDGTAETYVNMYQKIVDLAGHSNYIVLLNNHKILYAVDGAVKMMPEMKINVADNSSFASVFVGGFTYALIQGKTLDIAIKLANTAAGISLTKIGEETAIPSLNDVLTNSGLLNEFVKSDENEEPTKVETDVAPMMFDVPSSSSTPSENIPEKNINNVPEISMDTTDETVATSDNNPAFSNENTYSSGDSVTEIIPLEAITNAMNNTDSDNIAEQSNSSVEEMPETVSNEAPVEPTDDEKKIMQAFDVSSFTQNTTPSPSLNIENLNPSSGQTANMENSSTQTTEEHNIFDDPNYV